MIFKKAPSVCGCRFKAASSFCDIRKKTHSIPNKTRYFQLECLQLTVLKTRQDIKFNWTEVCPICVKHFFSEWLLETLSKRFNSNEVRIVGYNIQAWDRKTFFPTSNELLFEAYLKPVLQILEPL